MMDLAEQRLVEINKMHEHALFIGFNTPFFLQAKDYPTLNPNCIYFTEDGTDYIYSHKFGPHQMVVFNMEDGSFTDLFPGGNPWLNWPLPIWITPSHCQRNKGKISIELLHRSCICLLVSYKGLLKKLVIIILSKQTVYVLLKMFDLLLAVSVPC